MVSIDTLEDFIQAIQNHPELPKQMRRAIMTDEVTALPAQIAELLNTQNSMLKT